VPPRSSGNGWTDILNEFINGESPILDMTPAPNVGSLGVGHG
jgi:hypothetical protein